MRKKKLANKIVSILMAAMMVVSSPMSALAVATYAAENEAVVLQAETVTEEETQDAVDMQEDSADEDITVDDADLSITGGGRF